ncbi:uncharacterized protein LOC116347669 [Contarinia nasturtii]|uniref:uncharacterized protein LOC116347669 n=1 Tax=Contarinia nasturtii TaxID=265458 RepID=UPI0012D3B053|nr:uncharacterized protein LOC116347669 [Contarinia nasturtii]
MFEIAVTNVLANGETVVVDDELEFIHIPGQILKALEFQPVYQTKANDELCANTPYKENNDGDRAFMIHNGSESKEIWVSAHVVNGLIKINRNRPGIDFDCMFLKALLIGVCTFQKIKDAPVEDGIVALIKEFFSVRVGQDEIRIRKFEMLLDSAINGIKNNNFQP